MKVVLQNKTTRCFFVRGKCWVADIADAIHFENTVEAQKRSSEEGLSDVRILIRSENGPDIILPC